MMRFMRWVGVLACLALTYGCVPVDTIEFEPLYLQVNLPPPPVPDAKVTMTNSKGEAVFEGTTDGSGIARGNRGPGEMDHILDIQVVTPDGKSYNKRIQIWPDAILEYVHLNTINGEFTVRFRYPERPRGDTDSGEGGDHRR